MVGNAFGMLMILQRLLPQELPVVNRIVMACLVLHRYPTTQPEDFGLKDNYIPYDGCNTTWPALKAEEYSHFMNDRQLPSPMDKPLEY